MDCNCCTSEEPTDDSEQPVTRSAVDGGSALAGPDAILDREFPPEIVDALSRFHRVESDPKTYGEWVDALHEEVNGADWFPPTVDDLCTTDDSRHRAVVDGEVFHFICVLDALILAVLRDNTVSVRSASPTDGTTITAAVSPESVAVDPPGAVISFGVDADPDLDGDPTPADHYAHLCPYVHAFPDRDAYETWAADTDAPTDAFPFAAGLPLARAIGDVA